MFQLATQPQSIGQVLDSGFRLYRACLKPVIPLAFVGALFTALPSLLMTPPGDATAGSPPAAMSGADAVLMVVSFLATIVFFAAIIHSMNQTAKNEPCSASAAFKVGLKRGVPLFFGGFLYGLVVVMGFILLIVPGLILTVTAMLFSAAMIVDNLGPLDGVKKSHKLVWGNWWRTATVITVPTALYFALFIGAMIVFGVAGAAGTMDVSPTVASYGYALFTVVTSTLLSPLFYAVILTLYYDLKLRKEGGDLAARLTQ